MARKRDDAFILGAEPLEPAAEAVAPAAQSGSRNPFAPAPEPRDEPPRSSRLPRRPAALGLGLAVIAAAALVSRTLGGGEPSAPVRPALAPSPSPSAVLTPPRPRAQISRPAARRGPSLRPEAERPRRRPARRRASRSEPPSAEPPAPPVSAPAPVIEAAASPAPPDPPAAEPVESDPPPPPPPPAAAERPEFGIER